MWRGGGRASHRSFQVNSEVECRPRQWYSILSWFSSQQMEANRQDQIRRCIDLVRRDRIWSLSNHWERWSSLGYCICNGERGQSNSAQPHMKFIFNLYELWIRFCGEKKNCIYITRLTGVTCFMFAVIIFNTFYNWNHLF